MLAFGDQSSLSLADFQMKVNQWLLDGRNFHPTLALEISQIEPKADRLLAIVYLRRSGLLTGDSLDIDRIVLKNGKSTAQTVESQRMESDSD